MSTVVIATSGSPASRRAARRAVEVFAGAELVVATAVPGAPAPAASPVRAALDDLAVASARRELSSTCEALPVPVAAVLLRGDPVEVLCDAAAATSSDAIVVGSLGGTGGVAGELVRRAPCPVVELGSAAP
ncbi:MAG: universal stress protein [Acidimicrobiia bacterium]